MSSKIAFFDKNNVSLSQKIRYKIAEQVLKGITPSLFKKITTSIKLNRKFLNVDLLAVIPRPSIKAMKVWFNNAIVNGVEIGVRKGFNAESILIELNIDKLFLVDSWVNKEHFKIAFNRFNDSDRVVFIKELSNIAVNKFRDNSLDFVYIDGNHDFDFVFEDISLYYQKIKKNGVIAGHDVFACGGVLDAVKEFCFEKGLGFFIVYPDWYFIKEGLK